MKLKYEFAVREIVGDFVLVPLGEGALKLSGMITTNDVGAFLCELLKQDTTERALTERLVEEFEVDVATAADDVREFLDQMRQLDLIE